MAQLRMQLGMEGGVLSSLSPYNSKLPSSCDFTVLETCDWLRSRPGHWAVAVEHVGLKASATGF